MHHTEQLGHCHNRFAPYTWPYSRGKAKYYGDQLHLILDGDLCNRDFKRFEPWLVVLIAFAIVLMILFFCGVFYVRLHQGGVL